MKIRVFAILSLIAGSFAFASCIDDDATDEVIFNNDLAEIKGYLDTASIVNVKKVYDEGRGITIIWQELSGSKDTVSLGDTLRVNYVGRLLSNKAFDTSFEDIAKEEGIFSSQRKYEPLKFRIGLGQLIAGFELGALQMEVGDKATVFIPSFYAYGKHGSSDGRIPSNTPIMFELELLSVTPGPKQ
ncbi:FKBP-type peptidyl-prolyl cis-trans isomerase FklB [Algoriphagus sp. 4150]|uniref:FKBP-type peptidyl-prolyl cis-trans isomerase n=1 Tax=Algoriphagus sp. 4150 TaxID=2817756 RepID=UPI00285A3C75|nr:FKBP-type peptidyl-prolyl cis-trans isomerase [Algoriphagus sp. 4150]MDR7129804.1 FKBP-type peptidyl-prolyl cis-trans isomerase FklB [Algoriphagus sp. 4150]